MIQRCENKPSPPAKVCVPCLLFAFKFIQRRPKAGIEFGLLGLEFKEKQLLNHGARLQTEDTMLKKEHWRLREILQLSEIYSQTTKNVIMWPFI